jgi:hypothetical protein
MRKTWAVIGLTLIVLFAILPTTQPLWTPLRPAIVRVVEVVALPFRLVWLSAQLPDVMLLMPVAGAKVNRITDTWGAPRLGGRLHRGQDIFAPKGTAVRSATRGYVVRVGNNALGGKVVLIIGAGGRRYYYAHLDAFAPTLRVGTPVTPETIIGFVGNTGNAVHTPSHLHFGMYTVAGAVNPLPLLQDRAPSSSSGYGASTYGKGSQPVDFCCWRRSHCRIKVRTWNSTTVRRVTSTSTRTRFIPCSLKKNQLADWFAGRFFQGRFQGSLPLLIQPFLFSH